MNRRDAIRGLLFAPVLSLSTLTRFASSDVADVLLVTISHCSSDERMKLSNALAALEIDHVIVSGDVVGVKFEKFKRSRFDAREKVRIR